MWEYEVKFTETQSTVLNLSSWSPRFRRDCSTDWRQPLALLVFSLLPASGFAQLQPTKPANLELYVSETHDRVVFDKDAILSGPIPYWSQGYLISTETENFSPGTPNVALYSRSTGSKSTEVAFWFPESQRVVVTSAAVTNNSGIVASGEADKVDGTRAPFIALANSKGQITNVIQTQDFYPRNICAAPDGSVWAFGGMMWDYSKKEPFPGNILRRFDFQRGETASYIPLSSFPKRMGPAVLAFIRCTPDAVFAYSTRASVLIELQYKSQTPRIYNASTPDELVVWGLAVTGSDAVYGLLGDPPDRNDDSGKNGMYFLAVDERTQTAQWRPVKGAVGRRIDPGVVTDVWGADGENLVVSRAGDSLESTALHWVSILQK